MINEFPECGGCREKVEAGNGFYDRLNLVYMHWEEFNPTNRLHQKGKLKEKKINKIPGKTYIVSPSCAIAYTARKEEAYDFNPEEIEPVTDLDDIEKE